MSVLCEHPKSIDWLARPTLVGPCLAYAATHTVHMSTDGTFLP